jgi:hypothetical protein
MLLPLEYLDIDLETEKNRNLIEVEKSHDLRSAQTSLLSYPNEPANTELVLNKLAFILDYAYQDYEPYYLFLLAYVNKSSDDVDKAARIFRRMDEPWNEAIAHWFLGLLYRDKDEPVLAKVELTEAQNLFAKIGARSELVIGDYKKRDLCKELIQKIDETINEIPVVPKVVRKIAQIRSHYPIRQFVSIPQSDIQSLLSFPTYPSIHAAITGNFVSENEVVSLAEFLGISIDEMQYEIFNIRGNNTAAPIHLRPSGKYLWCRVEGNSMNQATPIPIDYNDFILLDTEISAAVNDIVVVSLLEPTSTGELPAIVKRLAQTELISESSEPYEGVKFTSVDGIRGVVIAVAKPIVAIQAESKQAELSARNSHGITELVFSLPENYRITPNFLLETIVPYLIALANIQRTIDEIQQKRYREIYITHIRQLSPISVSLDGASEAIQVAREITTPWMREHAKKLAYYEIEKEKADVSAKRADAENKWLEAAKSREELERIKIEKERLKMQMEQEKIQNLLKLSSTIMPDLTESEKIALMIKLNPELEVLISSILEIKSIRSV